MALQNTNSTSRINLSLPNKILPVVISRSYIIKQNITNIKFSKCEESKYMPPIKDLDQIIGSIKNDKDSYVDLPYGNFTLREIKRFRDFYIAKRVRHELETENKYVLNWQPLFTPIDNINFEKVVELKNILLNNTDSFKPNIPGNYQLSVSELKTLLCDRWLSDSVIEKIIELLKDRISDSDYVGYLNSIHDLKNLGSRLYAKHPNITKFVFVLCVKSLTHSSTGETITYIAGKDINIDTGEQIINGNHFSFCVYDVVINKVIYIDTLGLALPDSLMFNLNNFIRGYNSCLMNNLSVAEIQIAHSPNLNGYPHNACQEMCYLYPKQTCGSVCGPSVIVGITVLLLRQDIFNALLSTTYQKAITNELQAFKHFIPDFSLHSKSIRFALISWLMSGQINIDNILQKCDEQSSKHNLNNNTNVVIEQSIDSDDDFVPTKPVIPKAKGKQTLTTACNSNKVKSTENEKSDCLNKSSVDDYVEGGPSIVFSKKSSSLILKYKLKSTNKYLSKGFKCSHLGKGDSFAMKQLQEFILSENAVLWIQNKIKSDTNKQSLDLTLTPDHHTIFARQPIVYYCKQSNTLKLECFLKKGNPITKSFPCSAERLGDTEAIENIRLFFYSHSIYDWVKSKDNPMWKECGEVTVGNNTTNYFDKFGFDFTKDLQIASGVTSTYQTKNTMKVSVTENVNWGKTHRFDEIYQLTGDTYSDKNVPVVTMYIKCASKSNICKTKCHNAFIKDISGFNGDEISCPGCDTLIYCNKSKCTNCAVETSPLWFSINDKAYCNACYRYFRKHKVMRPSQLVLTTSNSNKVSTKNYEHFTCGWEIKLVIFSNDLNLWQIYEKNSNEKFHPSHLKSSEKCRPTLSTRDFWDQQRIYVKATPKQILSATNIQSTLHVSGNIALGNMDTNLNLRQISNRVQLVDRHDVKLSLKNQDEIPLPGSDWRNTEKLLEANFESVLLFQRGNDDLNRDYHIIFATQESLSFLRKLGNFIGMDVKHDFMAARFKTTCFTFCDEMNTGRAAAFAICNRETQSAHALSLQLLLANVPCNDPNCDHPSELFIFDDMNGFFTIKPCSLLHPFKPTIQHDKDSATRSAVDQIGLSSILCNFHSLQAFRRNIVENPQSKLFLRPLETGFKCVMRAWDQESRDILINNYIHFIQDIIPNNMMSASSKKDLISYLNRYWYCPLWSQSFTAEQMYLAHPSERRNPLILTDNVTERKFLDIDSTYLNSQLNRLMFSFVQKSLHRILPDDNNSCQQTFTTDSLFRKGKILNKQVERTVCDRALNLVATSAVYKIDLEQGWALIRSESRSTLDASSVEDNYFTGGQISDTKHVFDFEEPFPSSQITKSIFDMAKNVDDDHSYNIISKCKNIVSQLDLKVTQIMHDHLFDLLPIEFQDFMESYSHIVNLTLGVCSCTAFIIKGQPYLCKHLYACLAIKYNILTIDSLLHQGRLFFPSLINVSNLNTANSANVAIDDPLVGLQLISHKADQKDVDNAKLGKILSVLHDQSHTRISRPKGNLATRLPHNQGNRRLGDCVKDPKYDLLLPVPSQNLSDGIQDPYKPNVVFPDNSKERHGGRKRIPIASRGINFDKVVQQAMLSLGITLQSSEQDSVKVIDTDTQNIDINNDVPDICIDTKNKTANKIAKDSSQAECVKPITCFTCIQLNQKPPYTCKTQTELLRRISVSHNLRLLTCTKCFSDTGSIIQFENENQLKKHSRVSHSKLKLKKHLMTENDSETTFIAHIPNSVDNSCTKIRKIDENGCKRNLCALNNATNQELENIVKSKGTPGLRNLAKAKFEKISRKIPTASEFLSKEKKSKDLFNCSVCNLECSYDPPTIFCNKCEYWFHWHCVSIISEPLEEEWFCLECSQKC
ncbi:hypothetical protein SNE40_008445 [Patella caerulea]|uniref:PHD-type domain-containing protein n=1 Tax=Patella caerulea TaxID=87958 RepID=A0AAN8PZ09_PATCE